MSFTQIIEVNADDARSLQDHVFAYHDGQRDKAPGYRRARVLEDRDRPGTYLIEVDFSSSEDAEQNSARPETDAWAKELRARVKAAPVYRNLNEVCNTES
jgi:quinol monooxygenase YgiN